MTKKLYLYNNICYDVCPHGSEKDDKTFSCIEINKYNITNKTITVESFKDIEYDNRLEYLGDGYAKQTIQFIRAPDFSNFLCNETYDSYYNRTEIINRMKELKMPIYDFSECISKLREYYHLNDSVNIFSQIMEYNDVVDKRGKINSDVFINSTIFKFFLSDGKILDHC